MLLFLLSRRFLHSVLAGAVIAFPAGWYVMNQWLQNFAYHREIDLWTFIFAGGAALTVALIAASFQSVRAAVTNPVESLRYE
jgi:putative ABC transport system permease protein